MQKTGGVQAPSVLSCLFSYCPALKYSIKRTAPKVSKGRRLASDESAEGGSRKRSDNDRKALWGVRLSSPVATKRKPNESAETSGLWPRRLRLRTRPQARNLCLRKRNRFMQEQYQKRAANTMVCGPFAAMRDHLVAALRMGMARKISQPGCHSPHSKPSSR